MKTDSTAAAPVGAAMLEWRQGWQVVFAAAIGIAVAGSYMHFTGAMIRPLQEAYGWARGEIALGLTVMTMLSPLANVIAGALADRFGPRRMALWGSGTFALGFAVWGLAGPALWTWYLFCGLFALLSHIASVTIWTMMVVKRFNAQRGLALAMALSGSGLAIGVIPTLVLLLNQWFGVRETFFIWGLAGGALMFLPALLFFHERPPAALAADPAAPKPQVHGHTLPEALRDRNFWQFVASVLLVSLAVGTFIMHLQPMLLDTGFTPATAASVALFMGPSMIVGRIGMGMMFDYFNARVVSAIAFLLPGFACLMLLMMDGSYLQAAVTGVVIGLGLGAEMDVVAYVVSRYFGMRSYGKIFALVSGTYGMGIGVGSAFSGLLFDQTGSYNFALLLLAGFSLCAVLAVTTLGKPRAREEIAAPLAAH